MYYEVANGDQEILLLDVDDLFGRGEGKLILDSKRKLVTEFELEDLGIYTTSWIVKCGRNREGLC